MGLEVWGRGGAEEEKEKEKENKEKISHMCESIGHRPTGLLPYYLPQLQS